MNSMNKNKLTNLNVDNLNVNFTLEIKYLIMLKYIFIVKFKFGHGTKEYIPNVTWFRATFVYMYIISISLLRRGGGGLDYANNKHNS